MERREPINIVAVALVVTPGAARARGAGRVFVAVGSAAIPGAKEATETITALAEAGGLMGYRPNPQEAYGRSAIAVDKILAVDLPIAQPGKFERLINLRTAKAEDRENPGLTIPSSLAGLADRMIP